MNTSQKYEYCVLNAFNFPSRRAVNGESMSIYIWNRFSYENIIRTGKMTGTVELISCDSKLLSTFWR